MSNPTSPNEASNGFIPRSGRPPWYTSDGSSIRDAFLIGIAGGSASGKTSVSNRIIREMNVPWVVIISMDSFYKNLNQEARERAARNEYNFDHPDAFDFDLLHEKLSKLKQGLIVDIPMYDFTTHSRLTTTQKIYGASVIIFEGIFALYDKKVFEMMDVRIFVDTDDDVRLARRLKRDIASRGRSVQSVLDQYHKYVKPAFDDYIRPTLKNADVIIPRGLENNVAIDLLLKMIKRKLEENVSFKSELAKLHEGKHGLPESVILLEQKPQVVSLMTTIRDKNTNRDEFIFSSDRMCRMVVEKALTLLKFHEKSVITPIGKTYHGFTMADKICGVSIERAGVAMEVSLRQVCKDIKIGKLLIQTDTKTGDPQLPSDISSRKVLLMDVSVATGAAAIMAIRVLLDHFVLEENIIFMCLLAAPLGLHSISYAFPKVKIVVSQVDQVLNDKFYIVPGFGNFANRYFGTCNNNK
ncbi:uridine kinase [Rozella allomycis CSF55]|uniref:Uridine kinase n=1 Tax=Rozella allomycis (strain CSF55) TaxID=988480 RepID=A0A075B056_ROZAC|nr:Phosphoribulokinase/uridine kinase domain-containing protein [Rozella allomycis CSF55]RKP20303.1 uridine kinase [Rozella allomycis CSF55]|eukprot:EPZ34164.1 Phosphoribulokinase/uridine kinase domain-containing protein [Rozella allomycis CSF55]